MVTNRPPDPIRYAAVEKMVRKGYPDRDIVRECVAKFGVCENTIRTDLRMLWAELKEQNAEKLEHRRDVMRYQLEALQVEARDVATKASDGFATVGKDGEPVTVTDPKTASMALQTSERVFGRLAQLDGLSESDKVKLDILRTKMLGDLPPAEFEAMLKAEVEKLIDAMPLDELEAKIAARKAAQ